MSLNNSIWVRKVFTLPDENDAYDEEDFEQDKDASIQYESQENQLAKKASPKKPSPLKEETANQPQKLITSLKQEEKKLTTLQNKLQHKTNPPPPEPQEEQPEEEESKTEQPANPPTNGKLQNSDNKKQEETKDDK